MSDEHIVTYYEQNSIAFIHVLYILYHLTDEYHYKNIEDKPLFHPINRHGQIKPKRLNGSDIAVIIKRTAKAAGFEPEQFSGHSLRAGFATAAAAAGASDRAIKKQTGHKSDRILQRYIREGALFRENAASNVGL